MDLAESARMTKAHLRFWLPLSRIVGSGLLFILGTFRVTGKYRIPKEGGLLVLSNHLADLDPIVIQIACNRPVHFMGKSELFEMPVLGRVVRSFGGFPVRRGAPDRAPLKLAVQLLKDGDVVGVFPEGELSETGELLPFKPGITLIARLASGVPVICCGLRNTNAPMPYGKLVPRPGFKKIHVNWGEPRVFSKEDSVEEILAWAEAQIQSLRES